MAPAANQGVLVHDLLWEISYCLMEPVVNTTMGTLTGGSTPGSATFQPPSMANIYVGAILAAGNRGVNQEAVTVISMNSTSFTAVYALAHTGSNSLVGATFPSGQASSGGPPLFTQAELLAQVSDVQNDFLLKTRPVYVTADLSLNNTTRYYSAPADAIRIERISIAGKTLYNVSAIDLDLQDPSWTSSTAAAPTTWFQDETANVIQVGFRETPTGNVTATCWYSQRGAASLAYLDNMTVPISFCYIVKYGVLAQCYQKDGEQRDEFRSQICQRKFDFGVMITNTFTGELDAGPSSQPRTGTFAPLILKDDMTRA